jgi:hypothetical protein
VTTVVPLRLRIVSRVSQVPDCVIQCGKRSLEYPVQGPWAAIVKPFSKEVALEEDGMFGGLGERAMIEKDETDDRRRTKVRFEERGAIVDDVCIILDKQGGLCSRTSSLRYLGNRNTA